MIRCLGSLSVFLIISASAMAQTHHSADTDTDRVTSLAELIRVVQFYNANALHCANPPESTEDGYLPGLDASAESCAPHSSDYNPQDWIINLSELLRLIQFYNSGEYHQQCFTEDGFDPGAGVDLVCEGEGEGQGEAQPEGQPEGDGEADGGTEGGNEGEGGGDGEGQPGDTFTLSYEAGPGGSVVGPKLQLVETGNNGGEVTAVPDSGFVFAGWSDGYPDATRMDTNVQADLTVIASFAQGFTATYAAGPGGSVSGSTLQTIVSGGDAATVTAVANSGYEFTEWSDSVNTAERTDTNVQADINVTANFVEHFTLTYAAGARGTLQGETSQVLRLGEDGSPVTALADPGAVFTNWSDGVLTAERTDLDVQANLFAQAIFVQLYVLTYVAGPNGTVEGDLEQAIFPGADGASVTAVANNGFAFHHWSDGRTDNPRTDITVIADKTITAAFAPLFVLNYTAGPNGAIVGDTPQTVMLGADGAPVTATGDFSFAFLDWSDTLTGNPRTDTNIQANLDVTANFIQQYLLTYNAGLGGTIGGDTPQWINAGGDGATVTAIADTGYSFDIWSDGVTTASRTDTDIQADATVTALFGVKPVLRYTAGVNGSLEGTLVQEIEYHGAGTPVTAVPINGYLFAHWSDGRADNPRTDSGVIKDVNVTATFLQIPFMIDVPAGDFVMGRHVEQIGVTEGEGEPEPIFNDDGTSGFADEDPEHSVNLDAYQIGYLEVTNQQFCDLLNYARAPTHNYLRTATNEVWTGDGDIYAGDDLKRIVAITDPGCDIVWDIYDKIFEPKVRIGLPGETEYDMGPHPAHSFTWYGAVMFCNWLSEISGLTPVYSTTTWNATFANDGYRLPTEAEWERAAAWEGKHWGYGFKADTISPDRANYSPGDFQYVNPFGLTTEPFTHIVGWYNGGTINPNGGVQTTNAVSPVGAYDMSGNVWEWTNDWYDADYYLLSPENNPTGPATGDAKTYRGGSWGANFPRCRTAQRASIRPDLATFSIGLRLAR